MPEYDVVIKKVEPLSVAAIRDVIPAYPEQGNLWEELESYLAQHQITPEGPCFTVYYSDPPDIDAQVCEPVSEPFQGNQRIQLQMLPGIDTMATVVHQGPFLTIGEAYTAIIKWIEANDYQIKGPAREVYLRPAENASQTDPKTVTEIQFPVAKT